MSDLFHEGVPDDYIERVAGVMAASPWHTYQVLTKRSTRLRDLLRGRLDFAGGLTHIWWGVSVEDRRLGLPRVDHLRDSAAAMKFLSVEPLLEDLGDVDFIGNQSRVHARSDRLETTHGKENIHYAQGV